MGTWLGDSQLKKTQSGYYEPCVTKRLLNGCANLHVIDELQRACIRGTPYSTGLKLYIQRHNIPDNIAWSIIGRHDMFCGIFDSTGDRFYSGSHDGIVRVFDSSQRYFRLLKEIECPYSFWSVVSLALSPDERHLVYSVLSERIQLVSLDEDSDGPSSTLIEAGHTTGANRVPGESIGVVKTFSVCFDGSGSRVIAGHNSGIVQVYDIGDGRCVHYDSYCHDSYRDVNALTTVDSSGNVFLAGSDDSNIRVFDLRAFNEGALAVFTGHVDGITYLDSKGDGYYFLSNSKDQRVKLWDMRKHTKPGKERQRRPKFVWDYRYHSVPNAYLNANHDRPRRGDQSVLTLRGHSVRFSLIRARFSPAHSTGQRFAYAGSAHGSWPVWDLFTGTTVVYNAAGPHTIRDVHWHPWDAMAVSSGMDGTLRCWTNQSNRTAQAVDNDKQDAHGEPEASSGNHLADFASSDREEKRYEQSLARSGLRYQFPGDDRHDISSSHSSDSSYYDLIHYGHNDIEVDPDDDETFLTIMDSESSDSSYDQFIFGVFQSDDSDQDNEEFHGSWDRAIMELNGTPSGSYRRPVTRSQTRAGGRRRLLSPRAARSAVLERPVAPTPNALRRRSRVASSQRRTTHRAVTRSRASNRSGARQASIPQEPRRKRPRRR